MDAIEGLLNTPESRIEASCELEPSNKITLEEVRRYKRWSIFDDLSY